MQNRDATYLSIVSGRYSVEHRLIINGTIYNQNTDIVSIDINRALYEHFGAGNAVSNTLPADIVAKSVIRSPIVAQFRVFNRTAQSSWYPNGTYYLDDNRLNDNGITHIYGFDAMAKSDRVYSEGEYQTQTTLDIINQIATDIGVTVEADTLATITATPYPVQSITTGINGTTERELLQDIASAYGGNFTITADEKLRLVPLGLGENDSYNLGLLATDTKIGNPQTIDRVELWVADNMYYRYPIVSEADWSAMTGRILKPRCSFGTQDMAQAIYGIVNGLTQVAGDIQGASLDPAVELGDTITVNGEQLYASVLNSKLNDRNETNIQDNSEGDLEQQYDYQSSLMLQTVRNGVSIERTNDSFQFQVTKLNETIAETASGIRSSLTQTAESITARIKTVEGDLTEHAEEQSQYIQYSAQGLELGKSGSQARAILTPTQLQFQDKNGATKAYIGEDPNDDSAYKFFIINGHIVNQLELGDHWLLTASGSENDYRLTFKWKA